MLLFLQNISPPEVSQLWLCFLFWCTNYDKWVTVRMHKATQCDDGKRKEILGDVYVAISFEYHLRRSILCQLGYLRAVVVLIT